MANIRLIFGDTVPLAYVMNHKASCTMLKNFIFRINHDYEFPRSPNIHDSRNAVNQLIVTAGSRQLPGSNMHKLKVKLGLVPPKFAALNERSQQDVFAVYSRLQPKCFSVIRNPLHRFISGFLSKIYENTAPDHAGLRDRLTCFHGVDLSRNKQPKVTILQFLSWLETRNMETFDRHFRPQFFNLGLHAGNRVDTVLKYENREDMLDFMAGFLPREELMSFMTVRFNGTQRFSKDDFISDELVSRIKKLYRVDYENLYPELL